MKTVLMVAEKPSLAASIAKILSGNTSISRKGRYLWEHTWLDLFLKNKNSVLQTMFSDLVLVLFMNTMECYTGNMLILK